MFMLRWPSRDNLRSINYGRVSEGADRWSGRLGNMERQFCLAQCEQTVHVTWRSEFVSRELLYFLGDLSKVACPFLRRDGFN